MKASQIKATPTGDMEGLALSSDYVKVNNTYEQNMLVDFLLEPTQNDVAVKLSFTTLDNSKIDESNNEIQSGKLKTIVEAQFNGDTVVFEGIVTFIVSKVTLTINENIYDISLQF